MAGVMMSAVNCSIIPERSCQQPTVLVGMEAVLTLMTNGVLINDYFISLKFWLMVLAVWMWARNFSLVVCTFCSVVGFVFSSPMFLMSTSTLLSFLLKMPDSLLQLCFSSSNRCPQLIFFISFCCSLKASSTKMNLPGTDSLI